jgi:hypothetical protein
VAARERVPELGEGREPGGDLERGRDDLGKTSPAEQGLERIRSADREAATFVQLRGTRVHGPDGMGRARDRAPLIAGRKAKC